MERLCLPYTTSLREAETSDEEKEVSLKRPDPPLLQQNLEGLVGSLRLLAPFC